MAAGGELREAQKRISFGSRQERSTFPLQRGTDRLGIQLPALRGHPRLGPGCYLSQEGSSLRSSWGGKPLSKRGYVVGARTAQRFPPSPRPGTYRVDKELHRKVTWPGRFGSPDWALVPVPAKRMLKMEVQKLTTDREFRKNQDRVAYLRLYYS